jgi:hypothetical protein
VADGVPVRVHRSTKSLWPAIAVVGDVHPADGGDVGLRVVGRARLLVAVEQADGAAAVRIASADDTLRSSRAARSGRARLQPGAAVGLGQPTSRRKWLLSGLMVLRTPPPAGMLYECSAITSNSRLAAGRRSAVSWFSRCSMLSGR